MLYAIPTTSSREKAKVCANAVATHLGAKAKSNRQGVVGEPECHYEIRLNTNDIWFGVRFSDQQYVVRGIHKRAAEIHVPFCASLCAPYDVMQTSIKLEGVSRELGVNVYVADPLDGPATSAAFHAARVWEALRNLDFAGTSLMFVNSVQLYAINKFTNVELVAAQILCQRELLEALGSVVVPPNNSLERTRER